MKKNYWIIGLLFCLIVGLCSGCATAPAVIIENSPTEAAAEVSTTGWTIYTPASTSSIPVILAAEILDNVELVLYSNQSQASTLFLRGDTQMLVTGLSVGMDLFSNGAPVKIANTYVSGLSYIVTYGESINSFADLQGKEVYIPFEGSPIEEVCTYLAAQEGLAWNTDILPIYSPFDSSVPLLKSGEAFAVVLPEPMVSLMESQPDLYISLSLYDLWNESQPGDQGYPQVGSFVNAEWAEANPEAVAAFNQALLEAIQLVQADPEAAVASTIDYFTQPEAILTKALTRTNYQLFTGAEMQQTIENYYTVIGNPLDETFTTFFDVSKK